MRISEAAARLGMSPRMLRYREDLGLLPPLRDGLAGRSGVAGRAGVAGRDGLAGRAGVAGRDGRGGLGTRRRGPAHRQFTEADLEAITAGLRLEQRYDITPAALAFGLRVLTEPAVRAAVADLGRKTGHVPATPGRALDFEKERALRWLGAPPARR